eukprot:SAG31_NODE_33093_length_348_cov_0.550201_2_plen_64_part_01
MCLSSEPETAYDSDILHSTNIVNWGLHTRRMCLTRLTCPVKLSLHVGPIFRCPAEIPFDTLLAN